MVQRCGKLLRANVLTHFLSATEFMVDEFPNCNFKTKFKIISSKSSRKYEGTWSMSHVVYLREMHKYVVHVAFTMLYTLPPTDT